MVAGIIGAVVTLTRCKMHDDKQQRCIEQKTGKDDRSHCRLFRVVDGACLAHHSNLDLSRIGHLVLDLLGQIK